MTANKLMDLLGQYDGARQNREGVFSQPGRSMAALGVADRAQTDAAFAVADFLLSRADDLAQIFARQALHEAGHVRLADLWEKADGASDYDYATYASQAEQLGQRLCEDGNQMFVDLFQQLADPS